MKENITYKSSGVDIKKIKNSHSILSKVFNETFTFPTIGRVLTNIGHYAGLYEINSQIFAFHTDGVGTKVLVAQKMQKFDSIGIDCVAMNVNDIICVGACPLGIVDYIAISKPDEKIIKDIAKGLKKGAKEGGVAIIGGETAVVPEILSENEENTFDLAASVFGIVEKKPILGDQITSEDVILGIESNGIHSNGLTLARKILLSKHSIYDQCKYSDKSIGDELLKPTQIYVKPILDIIRKGIDLKGIAHITGGGFSKIKRLNDNYNYHLDNFPETKGIFKFIQEEGNVTPKEMLNTFNMGIGLCLMCSKNDEEEIIQYFHKYGMTCKRIGHVEKGKIGKVIVKSKGNSLIL